MRRRLSLTPRRRKSRQAAPEKLSIHQRPSSVAEQVAPGDLELDMMFVVNQSLQRLAEGVGGESEQGGASVHSERNGSVGDVWLLESRRVRAELH